MTLRLDPAMQTEQLVMDAPGGMVVRPPTRAYAPTFWPVQHLLCLQDKVNGPGMVFWQRRPGAVSYAPGSGLEAIAVRNATRERAFGFLPIPANPVTAHDRGVNAFHCALLFIPPGDGCPADIQGALGSAEPPWRSASRPALRHVTSALVSVGHPAVRVLAVKPASRGDGIIVRLFAPHPPPSPFSFALPGRAIRAALRCDARERDLEPLTVEDNLIHLTMDGTIATVRVLVG